VDQGWSGPNGSGKSTLKTVLPPELLGVYLNPDEIEAYIRQHGCLNVEAYGVQSESFSDVESTLAAARQSAALLSAIHCQSCGIRNGSEGED